MKLAKDFECVPAGEIYPRVIPAGEECPEELIDAARSLGLLADEKPAKDDAKKSDKA